MAERTQDDPRIQILLIEDNLEDAHVMEEALTAEKGMLTAVTHVERLADGLKHLEQSEFDLVLLDLLLPDSQGLEPVVKVHTRAPKVPIVVLTSSDDDAMAVQALERGAQDYLVKGYVQVYPNLLGRAIRYAIQRTRAEEQLRAMYTQTEKLLASLPSILIGVSPQGRITHWNAVAETTFGLSESDVINRDLKQCGIQWDPAALLEHIADPKSREGTARLDGVAFKRPDGQEGLLGITIVPMKADTPEHSGFLFCGADITERQRAEKERERLQEELNQAQKMETIGRFAGGIAHDFNNFLQVILGFAWLIRARNQEDPVLVKDLHEIVHSAESASGMVRQLLAFSRRQPIQRQPLELNQTLRNMERLLQQLIGDQIRLDFRLAREPLTVTMDPTGIEQIVMNLSTNARDSMPSGGTLTVSTEQVTIDESFLQARAWSVKPGAYVRLSIQDTGTGMDPDVAAHIFEPFFTTKRLGKGAGLGLAVVYGLVKQHEGVVEIKTAAGQGTTFHLYFPREEAAVEAATPAADGKPAAAAPGARRRVLVVDDHEPIRTLCARILNERYEVTAVSSADSALQELARNPYDLMLTDLRMPNMDGIALLQAVSSRHPAVKRMAMTGSLTNDLEQRLLSVSLDTGLIRKPFTAPALLEQVGRCLTENGGR
jgi:PAS domain S-box-containing protein